jgi:hypothetical protein
MEGQKMMSEHVHCHDGTYLTNHEGEPMHRFLRCACGAIQLANGTGKWMCPVPARPVGKGFLPGPNMECLEVLPCPIHGDCG